MKIRKFNNSNHFSVISDDILIYILFKFVDYESLYYNIFSVCKRFYNLINTIANKKFYIKRNFIISLQILQITNFMQDKNTKYIDLFQNNTQTRVFTKLPPEDEFYKNEITCYQIAGINEINPKSRYVGETQTFNIEISHYKKKYIMLCHIYIETCQREDTVFICSIQGNNIKELLVTINSKHAYFGKKILQMLHNEYCNVTKISDHEKKFYNCFMM